MIIYQLHETSGEYGDYMSRIIGSYMSYERAKEEKAKREKERVAKNSRIRHCLGCPYVGSWYGEDSDNRELIDQMTKYCDHSEIFTDEDGAILCRAYAGCLFDDGEFYIEEVEVEE